MKLSTLEVLCCPACRSDYDVKSFEKNDRPIRYGSLVCSKCNTAVPICAGFPLFTETAPYNEKQTTYEYLLSLENSLFGDPYRYEMFVRHKSRRKSHDAYAVFQPFNESSQAFLPLVPLLREILKPGDRILDTWCRTGWSAGFLGGMFSEQNVISIWEGNADTMGYRGFRYWFSQFPEENNIDVMFHSLDNPLPMKSHSFSAVHALDTLHRYKHDVMIPELLRVSKPDGAVIFPHVHLANAQPVPYFDRGGTIIHGKEYKEKFDKLLNGSGRKAFVLSEPEAFQITEQKPLRDNSDTPDYNGLVAIVPEKFDGFPLHRESVDPKDVGNSYIIVNPIHTINLATATVRLDENKLSGSVGKLFFRHPVYEKKLKSVAVDTLTVEQCEVIYWAKKAMTVAAIAKKMKRSTDELLEIVKPLLASELVQICKLTEAVARMQYYHSDQILLRPANRQTIKDLFDSAVREFADERLIISDEDDSVFHYRDAQEVVDAVTKKLSQSGFNKGDRIIVYSAINAESIFLFWAAMQMGIVFVPVDHDIPQNALQNIIIRVDPKLIFCDSERLRNIPVKNHIITVLFDSGNSDEPASGQTVFSDWLNDRNEDAISPPPVSPDDTAVMLFTSGTTGNSKGVLLSHGALYRSGLQMAEFYEWDKNDALFSLGELHAMSGLRNPCVATLHAGASFVVSNSKVRGNLAAVAQCIQKHKCTILSTVPAAIRQFIQFNERIGTETFSSLRYVLCTGSDLTESLMRSFEEHYRIPILNYYGLTETCGFCIGVPLNRNDTSGTSLGISFGCIAHVVDEIGRVLGSGQVGELRIYSDNLMQCYYQDESLTQSVLKNGWFYTGDLAQIMPDDYIVLTGRKKDIIKDKFGNVIYPSEVESCLAEHSGIEDVVVVGLRPLNEDEKLAAFIVPRAGFRQIEALQEELRKHVRDKIGPHKIPQIFQFKNNLIRNSNGKPDKKSLIEELNSKR